MVPNNDKQNICPSRPKLSEAWQCVQSVEDDATGGCLLLYMH